MLLEPLPRIGHDEDRIGGPRAHGHDGAGQRGLRQARMGQEQGPRDARQGTRQGRNDDEGIEPGLEVDDNQQIDQYDRSKQSEDQLGIGLVHE